MKVVYRNRTERYVLIETKSLHDLSGNLVVWLSNYNDDLINDFNECVDIIEIWQDGKLIAKRTEKSPELIELEELE